MISPRWLRLLPSCNCLPLPGHADDESRLAALKQQAKDLGIDSAVSFEMYVPRSTQFVFCRNSPVTLTRQLTFVGVCSNVSFARLKELMGSSAVGIHTMWNGAGRFIFY